MLHAWLYCGVAKISHTASRFRTALSRVYLPILKEKKDWGKIHSDKDTKEFIEQTESFVVNLERKIAHLKGEMDLKLAPGVNTYDDQEMTPNMYKKLSQDQALVQSYLGKYSLSTHLPYVILFPELTQCVCVCVFQ